MLAAPNNCGLFLGVCTGACSGKYLQSLPVFFALGAASSHCRVTIQEGVSASQNGKSPATLAEGCKTASAAVGKEHWAPEPAVICHTFDLVQVTASSLCGLRPCHVCQPVSPVGVVARRWVQDRQGPAALLSHQAQGVQSLCQGELGLVFLALGVNSTERPL